MKVLIAGLGGIGQRHVRNLRRLLGNEVEISAYRVRQLDHTLSDALEIEPDADVVQKYAIKTFNSLDEALAEQPDAVFVCNPSSLHLQVALASAEARCHLFIEKPLSHDYEKVDELISLVEQQDLNALVGYQMRFHPTLLQLRTLLMDRAVGRVLSVIAEVGEFLPGWHKYEDYRSLYASRADLGGGVVLSQIHELDYLYWLFGVPRRVFALGGHLSNLEIDVEDVASELLEFEVDGQIVPVQLHQDYLQRPPTRSCKVIGEAGRIIADFTEPALRFVDVDGEVTETKQTEFQRYQLFMDELSHFVACIEGKAKPLVTLRDGAQSLRMALAIKESMATGKVVELQ